jgi:hypothetical protein
LTQTWDETNACKEFADEDWELLGRWKEREMERKGKRKRRPKEG